jgi:hypothetical protein
MAEDYRAQAEKCRSLARRMTDDRAIDALLKLADEYDAKAEAARDAGIANSVPGGDEDSGPGESGEPVPRPE